MMLRIFARFLLTAGVAAVTQVQAGAQAPAASGAESSAYSQPAEASRAVPVAQPAANFEADAQQGSDSLGAPDPTKPLGRGDIVTFSITQDREPAKVMRVTDTGELDFSEFPKIGRISVAGRTCSQVATELKHKLEADYYNAADVVLGINRVNHSDSKGRVYLSGNVRIPGPQELPANERTMVSTAIIRAGGPDKFADGHKVQLTRKGKNGQPERFTVDVTAIIEKGRMDKDIQLEDGDYINVPQRLFNY